MDLSIIIVNWNSADYVKACIASIYREIRDIELEIIVVDNASYDGCEKILEKEFPQVIFKQNKANNGFASANNFGFSCSTGNVLLFLNPDTEIIGSALNTLYSKLHSITDVGAVGCRLLNSDLSLQTSCIQPFPTLLNQALDLDCLKNLTPKLKIWGMKPLFENSDLPEEVEVISGACLMVKRNVFEKAKQFSTDYFMYAEDLDLCYKINSAGYNNYYISAARIIHHGGGSTKNKVSSFSVVLMRESITKFLEKNKGKSTASLYRLVIGATSALRLLFMVVLAPLAITTGKFNLLSAPFKKWRMIFRWSLGIEKCEKISNKR